jgi:hypothetical protein
VQYSRVVSVTIGSERSQASGNAQSGGAAQ